MIPFFIADDTLVLDLVDVNVNISVVLSQEPRQLVIDHHPEK
jgi:hypothetical protein